MKTNPCAPRRCLHTEPTRRHTLLEGSNFALKPKGTHRLELVDGVYNCLYIQPTCECNSHWVLTCVRKQWMRVRWKRKALVIKKITWRSPSLGFNTRHSGHVEFDQSMGVKDFSCSTSRFMVNAKPRSCCIHFMNRSAFGLLWNHVSNKDKSLIDRVNPCLRHREPLRGSCIAHIR